MQKFWIDRFGTGTEPFDIGFTPVVAFVAGVAVAFC